MEGPKTKSIFSGQCVFTNKFSNNFFANPYSFILRSNFQTNPIQTNLTFMIRINRLFVSHGGNNNTDNLQFHEKTNYSYPAVFHD